MRLFERDFARKIDVTGDGNRVIDLRFVSAFLECLKSASDSTVGCSKLFDSVPNLRSFLAFGSDIFLKDSSAAHLFGRLLWEQEGTQ